MLHVLLVVHTPTNSYKVCLRRGVGGLKIAKVVC